MVNSYREPTKLIKHEKFMLNEVGMGDVIIFLSYLSEFHKNEIVNLSGENINLIKQRSFLKSSIDKKLNNAIKNGGTQVLDEVKKYNK